MPYPNEHTARQTDPAQYDEFRRFAPKGADGISMILGIKEGKSEVQSVRGDASKLTPSAFRKWLEDNDFDTGAVEEATRKSFDAFARWVPLTLSKAQEQREEGEAPAEVAEIGGICSTDDLDFEGEQIAQDGLDWSYFLRHGWFNHEHEQGPANVLGHPVKIEPVDDRRTRVEGVIYLAKDLGKRIYETAVALQKAGGARSLGFSIEGQVLQRDPTNPKRVLKARVLNVAITSAPVNPHTNLELIARSIGASVGYQEPTIPDADATLSALTQQSLDRKVSSATYGAPAKRTMTRAQVRELIRGRLHGVSEEHLDSVVDSVLKVAKTCAKHDKT